MKTIEPENPALTPLEILREYGPGAGFGEGICPEETARMFFESWINNNMAVLLMLSEYTKLKPREAQILKLGRFLATLERYYLFPRDKGLFLRSVAFLKEYLQDYPSVDEERSLQAGGMIRSLYGAMGLRVPSSPAQGGNA